MVALTNTGYRIGREYRKCIYSYRRENESAGACSDLDMHDRAARGERVLPALIARQPANFVKRGTTREIEEKSVQEKNGTARHLAA